jgi:glutamyl-tRNA reductase
VYLYTVDDLQAWVQEGIEGRKAAATQAEAIVDTRVVDFMQWLARRELVPTIQAITAQSETWRQSELDRALKLIAAGSDATQVMEQLSHRLGQKYLHGTLASLAEASAQDQSHLLASAEKFFLRKEHR